ncbi:hypothetical protein [Proteus mirabilis]|uniref:hypothetical protein n=1 Tax=Proteus mirabilis TaxID=584 RepID=UPI0018C4FE57|nr:hypothetical protein [Proteus mirabilis]HAT5559539.1 hypothetical protein [Proteus mirabilis]HAT5573567.1 hypothetical protein [Proteus mirabilis]HEJ0301565.1 hypothetical protein [Proteus mirabilis]
MKNNKHVKRNWHIEISDENFEIVNSNGKLVCTLLDHKDVFRNAILVSNSPFLLNSLVDIFLELRRLNKIDGLNGLNGNTVWNDNSDDLAFARDLIEFCHVKIPTEN